MKSFIPGIIAILTQILQVYSYGSGAPSSTCTSMTPGHGSQPNSVSPYTISVSAAQYTPGGSLTVNIAGGDYQGIILQARSVTNSNIVGTFSSPAASTNTKSMQCSAASDTITHSSTATKNAATTYTWQAPSNDVGNVEFVATVAQAKNTWWKSVKSTALARSAGVTTQSSQNNGSNNRTTAGSNQGSMETTTASGGQKHRTDVLPTILTTTVLMLVFNIFIAQV